MSDSISRRRLLSTAALAVGSLSLIDQSRSAAGAANRPPGDPYRGLKIGVATYTFRKFPADEMIKFVKRSGMKYVSVKDFHLKLNSTPDERKALAEKLKAAGIAPLSCGVIAMNNEKNAQHAFEYARDLGAPTIVCSTDPKALPILDKMVKDHDIRLAIHNHGPDTKIFQTPDEIFEHIKDLDPKIGLCIDIGHTLRAGTDPAASIRKCASRLHDIHLKDVSAAEKKGSCVEAGRGVLDFKAVLRAMLDVKFAHLAGWEYEKDADDPLPGLQESNGYVKGLLAGMEQARQTERGPAAERAWAI